MVSARWYRNAMVYAIDPATFADSNGDGWGDLGGVRDGLDYLQSLGVDCIWLLPFYRTPYRDNGYDISDFLSVDPRFGDLADFATLMREADERGIRVLIDLVVQHTSDQHPWFRAAIDDPGSSYHDYYIWADHPDDTSIEPIFPDAEDSIWTREERTGKFYRHVFYHHEPDLDHANPAVRHEIERVMEFWLRLGVAGFRVDAVPYMVERAAHAPGLDRPGFLRDLAHLVRRYRTDGILLAETDVAADEYLNYFGGDDGDGFHMLFNFYLNNYYFLSLARGTREPILRALHTLPAAPAETQYLNWIRNHDELDLERLTDTERAEVNHAFAPDKNMRLYGRGPRRRLAPMLDGDQRRIEMAHSVLMSLPGAVMIRYGDEIGMGDDLSQTDRAAVRTPMQWSWQHNAGFSPAPTDRLVRPVIADGPFGYQRVNVLAQQTHNDSLLERISRMLRTRRGLRQIGNGPWQAIDVGREEVLAILHGDGPMTNRVLMLANLADEDLEVALPDHLLNNGAVDLLADTRYDDLPARESKIGLCAYGYRWMRPG
jgi:maltose alpha-D-glucosyltransferase/alpha-amylase